MPFCEWFWCSFYGLCGLVNTPIHNLLFLLAHIKENNKNTTNFTKTIIKANMTKILLVSRKQIYNILGLYLSDARLNQES